MHDIQTMANDRQTYVEPRSLHVTSRPSRMTYRPWQMTGRPMHDLEVLEMSNQLIYMFLTYSDMFWHQKRQNYEYANWMHKIGHTILVALGS